MMAEAILGPQPTVVLSLSILYILRPLDVTKPYAVALFILPDLIKWGENFFFYICHGQCCVLYNCLYSVQL